MIRIAIVEDEDTFAEQLREYIEQFGLENEEQFCIKTFRDGDEITERYTGDFDIILMDIQMKFMDGMTAAEKIRETDPHVIIIFITNRADYAIRGYQVDALDYVMKPINYLSFSQKMFRALERLSNRQIVKIPVKTKNGLLRIDVGKIYYIESQIHNVTYHTALGDFTVRDKLQDIEETVLDHGFFRSNKGCLVNFKYVDGVQDGCCLIQGEKLPISRARKADFMAALTKYMGET